MSLDPLSMFVSSFYMAFGITLVVWYIKQRLGGADSRTL